MPGRVLLDTSVIVALLRGDETVAETLQNVDEVFTSIIALGELLYGVRRSAHPTKNRDRVDDFTASLDALPCDRLTAEVHSRLKHGLRQKGTPIPDNDLWVAATAVQYALVLASRDEHFAEIEEVTQEAW